MKIACIATSQVPSSTANSIQVMKACDALQQAGHEVCLWVPGAERTQAADLASFYGLKTCFGVRHLSAWKVLRRYDFAWRSLRAARTWGADLLYTWFLPDAVLGLWAKLPVILELHDLPTGNAGPGWFRRFVKAAGKKRLLVITSALQKALEEKYTIRFDPQEVQVAPNGVDWEDYDALPERRRPARHWVFLNSRPQFIPDISMPGAAWICCLALQNVCLKYTSCGWVGAAGRGRLAGAFAGESVSNVTLTGFVDKRRLPLYQRRETSC